jgi:outer membrane protein assembly factor BamE (lipoprotein component of BamABCDE complex)
MLASRCRLLAPTRTLSLAALCSGLLACAVHGSSFQSDLIPQIRRGQTTQGEIQSWFGKPIATRDWGGGGSNWEYLHQEEKRRDTGSVTKVGRFVASLLGARVIVPPVDVEYKNTTRHRLDLWFDAEGVVLDFRHEDVEIPSKRVY